MIQEDVRKEMNAEEDDIEHANLTISMEPQVPTTMRLSKKTSILELCHGMTSTPSFSISNSI